MTYVLHSIRSSRPLECRTLQEAMARAGHPDPADWLPYVGVPDTIVTESMANEPAIEAAGVAHELIGLMPVGACATRVWSDADPAIACAVVTALPSPFLVSVAVAARLSAHYAVAGVLSWTTIGDTIAGASGDALAGHASDLDLIIPAVIAALGAAGIPTVAPPPRAARALRAASWRPGIAWLSSDGAPARSIEVWLLDLKTGVGPLQGWNQNWPVTRWLDAADRRCFTTLGRAIDLLAAFDTWARRIMRPVWTITVPGGKLPARWRTRLSRLLSGVLPMAVCCAGIFGGWHAARSTAVWDGAWQGAWPGITLWVITWWLVSLIPEKLLGFWLRPDTTPHRDRSTPSAARLLVVPDETALILRQAGQRHLRALWRPSRHRTTAQPEPLAGGPRHLALQGRRSGLPVCRSATPGHPKQLPPAGRQVRRRDGQQ